ncbi:hypothetical protein FA13DRAFT_1739108 [Coprinellus micaceus]|uniref:Uncharacterized protein n=1 Tax=Coprinellus micaceus TaxID=71717 RepID=A0A4Y7SRQ7_COPMI|nr:hypothetical protein FA13DRAFT_1739108 [Coprinellus micaceus]
MFSCFEVRTNQEPRPVEFWTWKASSPTAERTRTSDYGRGKLTSVGALSDSGYSVRERPSREG